MTDIEELANGEYMHIEYLKLNSVEDGGYFSNMVDLAHTRGEAAQKVQELLLSSDVYAIHVRRLPHDKGVHLYDESQPLAVAQGEAHAAQQAYSRVLKAYDELLEQKVHRENNYEWEVEHQAIQLDALEEVVRTLQSRLELIQERAARDIECCVTMEPQDVHRYASIDVKKLREVARQNAKVSSMERKKREAQATEG